MTDQNQSLVSFFTTPGSNNPLSTESCPNPNPTAAVGLLGFNAQLNWQSSATCNITNINMVCQGLISTQIINTNSVSQSNVIFLNFQCDPEEDGYDKDECDTLTISGNKFDQTNYADSKAVQVAYVSNTSQQNMSLILSQAAKATSKGLSLMPQSSSATNIINAFMKMQMAIVTDITNICDTDEANTFSLNAEGYRTVNFTDNIIDQTNVAYSDCTQKAIVSSEMSQSMSATIQQYASAMSAGLSFFSLLLFGILGIVAFVAFLYLESYYIFFLVWLGLCLGGGVLIFLGVREHNDSSWYGYSPGVPNTSDANKFELVSADVPYDNPVKAKTDFDNNFDKYDAMDYLLDDYAGGTQSGKATFYKLINRDANDINDMLEDITNYTKDNQNYLISFRNPSFQNKPFGAPTVFYNSDGTLEDKDVFYPDVHLNSKNGDLRYLLPQFKDPTDPSKGIDTDGKVTYQLPSTLNSKTPDNVLVGVQDIADNAQVFFWVEPGLKTTKVPDMSKSKVNLYGNGDVTQLVTTDADFPPTGTTQLDPDSECAGGTKCSTVVADGQLPENYPISLYAKKVIHTTTKSKVGKDYFLVVFPYGPPADNPDPSLPKNFERYDTAPMYYLYQSFLTDNGDWIPYVSDFTTPTAADMASKFTLVAADTQALSESKYTWANPIKKIVGYNLVPIFTQSRSTLIRYHQNTPWEWMLGASMLATSVPMFFGFMYTYGKSSSKKKQITYSYGNQKNDTPSS